MDNSNIPSEDEPVHSSGPLNRVDTPPPLPDLHQSKGVNPFRLLWDLGYKRLVPIVPPNAELSPHSSLASRPKCRGKAVGELGPHGWRGKNWHVHTTVEDDLDPWHGMGAGVGIRTGEGLIGIDIDSLTPELAAKAQAAALEILGPAPRRIGRAPKLLLPYRVTAPMGYQRVEFVGAGGKIERVEMLSDGRQLVALAIHPDTMKSYAWPDGLWPFERLTEVTPEQVEAYFQRLVEIMPKGQRPKASGASNVDYSLIDQSRLRGPYEAVKRAVEAIPNDRQDRELYIRLGYAIQAALADESEDDAFGVFWDWASKRPQGKDYDQAFADWNSFKGPKGIGAMRIYKLAKDATGEDHMPPEQFFQDESGEPGSERQPTSIQRTGLTFVPLENWAKAALTSQAQPLIKGFLDQGAMSVVYGESNVGKTFVTMDMAYHIAKGLPWGGMKTTQMVVAYVAAEGGQGARKRCAALFKKYGSCPNFYILPVSVDLLHHRDGDLQPLIEALKGLGVDIGLVVVDTLSRALAGGDENSSTDMGAIVRHLDTIRNAVKAHVLVVHHSGKDRARGARGHSLLRAATDTEIEVSQGQITVTKQRDLDKSYATAFELDVVELGKDEDGDPVTSCTIKLLGKAIDGAPGVATPKEQEILDGLEVCLEKSSDPGSGVRQAELVAFFDDPAFNKEVVRFQLNSLRTKRLAFRLSRGCWTTRCRQVGDENTWFDEENRQLPAFQSGETYRPASPFD